MQCLLNTGILTMQGHVYLLIPLIAQILNLSNIQSKHSHFFLLYEPGTERTKRILCIYYFTYTKFSAHKEFKFIQEHCELKHIQWVQKEFYKYWQVIPISPSNVCPCAYSHFVHCLKQDCSQNSCLHNALEHIVFSLQFRINLTKWSRSSSILSTPD